MKLDRTYYKISTSTKGPIIVKEFNAPHLEYTVTYNPSLGARPLSDLIINEFEVIPFSISLLVEAKVDLRLTSKNNKHYAGTYSHKFVHKGVVSIENGELDFHVEPIDYDAYTAKNFKFTNLTTETEDGPILDYLQHALKHVVRTKDLIDFLSKHTSFEMIDE